MERLTEHHADGKGSYMACSEACERYDCGICKNLDDLVDRLAAYEDTGLAPEEITVERFGRVFYCNRQCNLDGDFCPEGPGCPNELSTEEARELLKGTGTNPPLTLDELREMSGEPVWVAWELDSLKGSWRIMDGFFRWDDDGPEEEIVKFVGTWPNYAVDYGKTWLAYRRRPEGV